MVGSILMILTIPILSISFLLRIAIASVFLLPLGGCHGENDSKNPPSANVATTSEIPHSAVDFVNSIGLNTHLNYFDTIYGNFPLVERELKSVGVRHLRDGIHLQNADYNTMLYGRWIQLGNLGVRFDAVLDPRSNLGPLSNDLLNKAEILAGHTIESFEGPNEMDLSNTADWAANDRSYQAQIFASARAMQGGGSIKVIGPSLAFASKSSQVGNISNEMDEGNLHPYPAGHVPSVVFPDQVIFERGMCGDKPIVFTESGYHNAINERNDQPGVSEAAAAKYIPRLFLENYMRGIPRTYLYEFMDEKPNPGLTDPQLHWGLIRADGSEKPAFLALKNLIGELNDSTEPAALQPMTWNLSAEDAQIHHLLLQKSNGIYDLVLWQEITSYNLHSHLDIDNPVITATLTLGQKAHTIKIYQPVTGANPIRVWRDIKSVQLEIPDHPLVVEIAY